MEYEVVVHRCTTYGYQVRIALIPIGAWYETSTWRPLMERLDASCRTSFGRQGYKWDRTVGGAAPDFKYGFNYYFRHETDAAMFRLHI